MMLEEPTDSEDETIEELYEGDDDVEAEIDEGGDPALTPGEVPEDVTEEGDDVCVPNCLYVVMVSNYAYLVCRNLIQTNPVPKRRRRRKRRKRTINYLI